MASAFVAGITPDARAKDGRRLFDFGLLEVAPFIACRDLDAAEGELTPSVVSGLDALVLASSRFHVSRATIEGTDRLTLIARLGAGYETIDVEACTHAG